MDSETMNPVNAYSIFQYGTSGLFALPEARFHINKDLFQWSSNEFIAPLVNTIASIVWGALVLLIMNVFVKKPDNGSTFWKRCFFINLSLSAACFIAWWFMSPDMIMNYYYESSPPVLHHIFSWICIIFFCPSILPHCIAQLWFMQGTDSARGHDNLYLISQTASAFATLFWSVIVSLLYTLIKKRTPSTVTD